MKRWMTVLLVCALLATVGCAAQGPIGIDPASLLPSTPAAEPVPATDEPVTEAPAETEPLPAQTEPTETEASTEAPPEAPKLDSTEAYKLFAESRDESGTYTVRFDDDYSYDSSYVYHVPQFTIDTTGAQAINAALETRFGEPVDEALQNIRDGIGTSLMEVNWFLTVWENRICLIVYESYDWSEVNYEVYYYDANSGTELTASQMLALTGVSESKFLDTVRAEVRTRFAENYSWIEEADRESYGYDTMLAMADGSEIINMTLVKFYVYSDGDIYVYAPVPSLAGASYYYEEFAPNFMN